MVTLVKYGNNYNIGIMELDGLSTETKPINKFENMAIPNGSRFTELDTGITYMYDADNATWHRVSVDGGDSYTKAETDALLDEKADLDNDGLIPTSQIPPEVFERMKVVQDDTERFSLTTYDVQNGDVVYVDSNEMMYYVYDDTKLNREAGYKPFAAGIAAKAIADKYGNDITTSYVPVFGNYFLVNGTRIYVSPTAPTGARSGDFWIGDKLRKLITATAVIEPTIYTDGTAITAYTIKGNSPQGCGEPTANLYDNTTKLYQAYIVVASNQWRGSATAASVRIPCNPETTYTISTAKPYSIFRVAECTTDDVPVDGSGTSNVDITVLENGSDINTTTVTTSANAKYLIFQSNTNAASEWMASLNVNEGSTQQPYEPYGFKIPISNGQQSIDIYIGSSPLLKSLDGTAVDEISNGTLTRRVDTDGSVLPTPITTQITMPAIPTTEGANSITVATTVQPSEFTATWTGWHNT